MLQNTRFTERVPLRDWLIHAVLIGLWGTILASWNQLNTVLLVISHLFLLILYLFYLNRNLHNRTRAFVELHQSFASVVERTPKLANTLVMTSTQSVIGIVCYRLYCTHKPDPSSRATRPTEELFHCRLRPTIRIERKRHADFRRPEELDWRTHLVLVHGTSDAFVESVFANEKLRQSLAQLLLMGWDHVLLYADEPVSIWSNDLKLDPQENDWSTIHYLLETIGAELPPYRQAWPLSRGHLVLSASILLNLLGILSLVWPLTYGAYLQPPFLLGTVLPTLLGMGLMMVGLHLTYTRLFPFSSGRLLNGVFPVFIWSAMCMPSITQIGNAALDFSSPVEKRYALDYVDRRVQKVGARGITIEVEHFSMRVTDRTVNSDLQLPISAELYSTLAPDSIPIRRRTLILRTKAGLFGWPWLQDVREAED